MSRFSQALSGLAAIFFLWLLAPAAASAVEGFLYLPDGAPAAGYQVSVVGMTVTVTTNEEGRFRILPSPAPPFRVIATSPGGEVSPPIDVETAAAGETLTLTVPTAFKDSITVATGVAPNIEAPPAAGTIVLGQEDLEQRQPPRLADAIQGVAGISRTDETATGVPVVRGLGRGRTLILLDGSRVTTERRAGASASYLDPFTLSSIEIARGPGSVAYGSDAFGGVIHARPRYPEPGQPTFQFRIDQGFAADDETAAGLEISRDALGGALLGQLTWRSSGLQEAGGGEEIPGSEYEDRSGAIRYTRDTRLGRVRAAFSAADATDVGKPASDWADSQTVYPTERSRRFNLQLDSGPVGGWETVEMGLFLGTYRLVTQRDRVSASPRLIETSDVDANDGSLRGVATREAFGGRLMVGAEVVSRFGLEAVSLRETLDAAGQRTSFQQLPSVDDAQQVDTAVFTSYDRTLAPRLLLSAGLRGDRVETENQGGFFGDRSTSHSGLSGHAALTVGPFQDVTATLQVARGFRDPLLSDRYFRGPSGRGFITGNPDLEPERSLQYDASVRWAVGGGSLSVYGYLYQIDDLVERFRTGQDFFFRNRGEAEVKGLEVEGVMPLPAGFSLELAAAVARGEADDGSPLDDIAAPNGAVTVRWGGERGFAFTRGAYFMEDDRPGPIEVERPSHAVLDAGAGWRITGPLELRLTARNLTDKRYYDSADEVASLARGRSVSLGLVGRY